MDTSKIADIIKMKVDAIVGNPPWAALSHLPDAPYKIPSQGSQFWYPRRFHSHHHQNISTPFILIASKMYLRETGHFGFILPRYNQRRAHELFRRSAFRNSRAGSSVVSQNTRFDKEIFETLPATVWFGSNSSSKQDYPIQAAIWPQLFSETKGPHQLTL